MKNLQDWNYERQAYWSNLRRKVTHPEEFPNGFECPECGGALYDTGRMLLKSPPELQVKCQICKFKGSRYE